ncbi:unnamed protein product [Cylindrotheca closterium]|uniref:MI domain-containing protein n=1 Tax=Cylindrotheca closterium TaxID=2856 RepID=A0AAD2FZN4_9STRA|nr:unnamed protein product [Cylindrotheca closterium]
MFSWSTSTDNAPEDVAETDTSTLSRIKSALTPESVSASATTATASAAASSTKAAADDIVQTVVTDATTAVAKSWFREVIDAILLIALLHLVNLGFRWWNERRLLRRKHKKASGGASITTHTSASSSLMKKGGKFGGGGFARNITNKLNKKKKNARFQLSTGFSASDDVTSTSRTSNLTGNNYNTKDDEESHSESTLNSNSQRLSRYGLQQRPNPHELHRRSAMGRTWSIPQGGGNLPVIFNFATTSMEECLDQVDLLDVKDERELVDILVKCCSQEQVYFENYGAVAAHLCHNTNMTPRHSNLGGSSSNSKSGLPPRSPRFPTRSARSKWRQALEHKFASCYRKETKKLRKLRNMAMFFSHLLVNNAISYQIFDIVKLSEKTTTPSCRYFLKILLKDLAQHLTLPRLQRRIQEFSHAFAGLVLLLNTSTNNNNNNTASGASTGGGSRASFTSTTSTLTSYTTNSVLQNAKNMKFAVHFLTEIGLKPLTMDMREHLSKMEKEERVQRQRQRKNALQNKMKGLHVVEDSDNSHSGRLYEEIPSISSHSVVTDGASSTASSINSTSVQSNGGPCIDEVIDGRPTTRSSQHSQHSVISQLSTSTRSKSTSLRGTAASAAAVMNTTPPYLRTISSNNSLAPSEHSFESLGARSASSTTAKKVRSSHRKLSRNIVPHKPNLASRNVSAPQTPQHYKRQLFGPSSRVSKSLSPKPTSSADRKAYRLPPTTPNLHDNLEDAEVMSSSSSSSDSEMLPKPRSGAVLVNDDDGGVDSDDDDDDDDLKDDIEDGSYDIYYGSHNLGLGKKGGNKMEPLPEDTDGSVDTFHLPTDDEEDEGHDLKQDDFQVTGRRNVLFRKRPSIINEESL